MVRPLATRARSSVDEMSTRRVSSTCTRSPDSAGTGYTGSFQPAWCGIFERRGVELAIGYVGSQFTQGKRTVRADARAAAVWMRPAAFCANTGL